MCNDVGVLLKSAKLNPSIYYTYKSEVYKVPKYIVTDLINDFRKYMVVIAAIRPFPCVDRTI